MINKFSKELLSARSNSRAKISIYGWLDYSRSPFFM